MCFAPKVPEAPPPPPPAPPVNPIEIGVSDEQLGKKKKKKLMGPSALQIPLVGGDPTSGLGIPGTGV
jgi:hypothetical protein